MEYTTLFLFGLLMGVALAMPALVSAASLPGCDIQGSTVSVITKRLPADLEPSRHAYHVAKISITQSSWHGPNAAMGCAELADTPQSVIVPMRAYNKLIVKNGQSISGLMKSVDDFTLSFLTGIKQIEKSAK